MFEALYNRNPVCGVSEKAKPKHINFQFIALNMKSINSNYYSRLSNSSMTYAARLCRKYFINV